MKKINIIKNPETFQGKKHLKNNKNYFEGWYFKISKQKDNIAFIPGININKTKKKAFIQIITNKSSYYINYNIKDFVYNDNPFYIKIGNNYFSKEKIHIDINDKKQKIYILGDIILSDNKNIKANLLNPNIMGPFSYIPFMECNHAILSMKSNSNGIIKLNNKKYNFNNGNCYIEKDWGTSFPKKYIWCQGNSFKNKNTSFMLSIADIPFKIFNFEGFICVLLIDDKEYKFTSYNNAKLIKYEKNNNNIEIVLKKEHYILNIISSIKNSNKLIAPIKGNMNKEIKESITSTINITLKKDNKIIFSDTSNNCGLEIVY